MERQGMLPQLRGVPAALLAPVDAADIQVSGKRVPVAFPPIKFLDLGTTLGALAEVLEDPVEVEKAWIANRQHRGLSGRVSGGSLRALVPSVVADASVGLTVWFHDDDLVRRVRIEGAVTPGAVWVLELSGFDEHVSIEPLP
jgi:hypothetical protein